MKSKVAPKSQKSNHQVKTGQVVHIVRKQRKPHPSTVQMTTALTLDGELPSLPQVSIKEENRLQLSSEAEMEKKAVARTLLRKVFEIPIRRMVQRGTSFEIELENDMLIPIGTILGGHLKTGQWWSGQNRPTDQPLGTVSESLLRSCRSVVQIKSSCLR